MIILGTNSIKATGFDVANSLRFNDGSSDYLNKTASAGNRRTFTFSTWLKLSQLTTARYLFTSYSANNDAGFTYLAITDGDKIKFAGYGTTYLETNQLLRDPSSWYHLMLAVDTTNGTANNRCRIYLNGSEITSFGTRNNPSQNADLAYNQNNVDLVLSSNNYGGSKGNYYDGYLAETVLIDGSQLAADQFGEFDSDSGIWKPIDVSGLTFGNNGFYLDFEDSSNLGNDANGGTDFGETNIAAIDQSTDTCTNNFATMNPLDNYYAGATFSEGNCRVVTGSSPETWNTSTFGLNSGKWYMEFTIIDEGSGGSTLIGIADRPTVSASEELGGLATTYAYLSSGNFRTNNSNTSNSVSATDGDIIGVALDLDSAQNTISYYKNDSIIVAAQNITAPVSGFYFIASGVWLDNDTGTNDHNFGNPVVAHSSAQTDANGYGSFEYAPPSGYYAICTKNLAEYG